MTRIRHCGLWATLLLAALPAGAETIARGTLETGDPSAWAVTDTETRTASVAILRRSVVDAAGVSRYSSRTTMERNRVSWAVEQGHPAQRVAIEINEGEVIARDMQGQERWRAVPDAPLCLPELVADLAVQMDEQSAGDDGLACLVPIDKAKKLAPLRLRRLSDAVDGSRRYALLPGSLGMRLFFSRQTFTVSADGRRLLGADGQFEVARSLDGRLRYVEGTLRYTVARELRPLPAALLRPAAKP